MDNCLTVQMLIDELNKVQNKNLYVLDSANDFIEEVMAKKIKGENYIQIL